MSMGLVVFAIMCQVDLTTSVEPREHQVSCVKRTLFCSNLELKSILTVFVQYSSSRVPVPCNKHHVFVMKVVHK